MPNFSRLQDAKTQQERYDAWLALRAAYLPEYLVRDLSDPGNVDAWIACALYGFLVGQEAVEAKESEFLSCRRRSAFRSHLTAMGVAYPSPAAAVVDELLTLSDDADAPMTDIDLERYHPFRNPSTGQVYSLFEDNAVWPAGRRQVSVQLIHGEVVDEEVGTTDGTPNQRLWTFTDQIVHGPGQETVEVLVGETRYRVVTDFGQTGSDDTDILMTRLEDGRMLFRTGDGINGLLPEAGLAVNVRMLRGGGPSGSCGPDAITEIAAPISYLGGTLSVAVTNPLASSSGNSGLSLTVMRSLAPLLSRAQNRIVTPRDFTAYARSVPGVLDARAERIGVSAVKVRVASGTTGVPPNALLSEVRRVLLPRMNDGDTLVVAAPDVVRVRAEFRYRPKADVRTPVNVERAMRAVLTDYADLQLRSDAGEALFGAPLKEWGEQDGSLFISDLQGLLENADGVDSFETDWFSRIPTAIRTQWSGNAGFSAIVTSETTVYERWDVYFLSSTVFIVTGSVSGFVGQGRVDYAFSDPRSKVAFTLQAGTNPMREGDRAYFSTSPKVGSIVLARSEIPVLGSTRITPVTS